MRKIHIKFLDLVFLVIFGLLYWKPFVFNVSSDFDVAIPLNRKSLGIDVSHHQGAINWDTLIEDQSIQPKIEFIFLKATEGVDFVDKEFSKNLSSLRNHSISKGAYHFFLPNKNSRRQADHFLSQVDLKKFDLPPVLDVELESETQLLDSVKVWLDRVEHRSGKRPIIYTSWSLYKKYFKEFKTYKFWVARYSNSIDFTAYPNIIYWQFSDEANLPHHNSKVDLNVSPISFN